MIISQKASKKRIKGIKKEHKKNKRHY